MTLVCGKWTKQGNKQSPAHWEALPRKIRLRVANKAMKGSKAYRDSHSTAIAQWWWPCSLYCQENVWAFFFHFVLEYILITPWTKPLWPKEVLFLCLEGSYGDIRTQHHCHIYHWWARAMTAPPGGANTGCSAELSEITTRGIESPPAGNHCHPSAAVKCVTDNCVDLTTLPSPPDSTDIWANAGCIYLLWKWLGK